MSRKEERRKERKGTIVGFVVTAAVLGSIFHPVGILPIAVLGGAAFLVGKVVGIMSSPLDTTTHNKQDQPQREMETLAQNPTGDDSADAIIAKGQEMLRQIRAENAAIPDQKLSEQMYELEHLCVQIFKTVAEKPHKASQIRKFMNYYLPTTLKMLASYRTMQNRGVSRGDLMEARETLIRGMNMVLTACQKQLDNLFKDDMLDVSTDIDVLEQMLKRDGFVDGGLGSIPVEESTPVQQSAPAAKPAEQIVTPEPEEIHRAPVMENPAARTAASAQMGTQSRPTLHVDENGDGIDDFQSFYQKR